MVSVLRLPVTSVASSAVGSSNPGLRSASSRTVASPASFVPFRVPLGAPLPVSRSPSRSHRAADRQSVRSMATDAAATLPAKSGEILPGEPLPEGYEKMDPYSLIPARRCGVLVHPTSLPGPHGIGDFGPGAFKFLDWLESTGCTIWQVLPLVPPGRKSGEDGSPYAGQDANCGNTLLLSLDLLVQDGLLEPSDLPPTRPVQRVDYKQVIRDKDPAVAKAARALVRSKGKLKEDFDAFRQAPTISAWLEEAALFSAIDGEQGVEFWWLWPKELRDREPQAIAAAKERHREYIDEFAAQQFLFQRQWQALHRHANSKGIRIMGDMPIYVGGHSADVWANPEQFMLDPETRKPTLVSGVPPDAFSATGQLWGSPLYNWPAMAKDGYSWWAKRMRRAFDLYDEFRIDHFRGLAGYWSIPADSETAMNGTWTMGPRKAFFEAIQKAVDKPIDIVAEDLGVITVDVVDLRREIGAPGMAVLQFAFGSDAKNPHLPHNHEQNQVVYPGTHDNDTVVGWWEGIPEWEKNNVRVLLGLTPEQEKEIQWAIIRAAVSSVARTTVIALQDVMGLDNSARMNVPAVQAGQWGWRAGESGLFDSLDAEAARLRMLLVAFNRAAPLPGNWTAFWRFLQRREAALFAPPLSETPPAAPSVKTSDK
ncbi:hypothetical protein CLOP_g4076 [Closterium sp. NIES-67]|nr:hypothetical protein CLOP_g4076 [Closterium sp. NIES-67]